MKSSITLFLAIALAGEAFPQAVNMPAARAHVKQVGANYVKYTSKLQTVVELNFTMGNTHQPGKQIISASLDRIAKGYAIGGVNAFTVKHISTSQDGSVRGEIPNFTIDDLMAGQVIVANNVGYFGDAALGSAKQQAIQTAIEVEGRGYLGFHGSGDNNKSGWPWYTNSLHPMNYAGHGSRVTAPVYKHLEQAQHIILQGVLSSKTTPATVPNEMNGATEVLAQNVPTRAMKNEWYRFGRDISRDPTYASKVTVLLKYDPRQLGQDVLADQYRRKGGNLYTYTYQVGKGLTSYIPAGHENDELLDPTTGFDGGAGDFDRYVAQTLFFLAGYTTSICDASCSGLPLVNAANQLMGTTLIVPGVVGHLEKDLWLDAAKPAFSSPYQMKYEARLIDMSGRLVEMKAGAGPTYHEFKTSGLKPGVYVLSVKAGRKAHQTRRYYISSPR